MFKYRVKGKVEGGFILRGFAFDVGESVDLHIFERELEFIKDHCKIDEIVDLSKTADPILNKPEIKKEAKNVRKRSNTKTATKSEV